MSFYLSSRARTRRETQLLTDVTRKRHMIFVVTYKETGELPPPPRSTLKRMIFIEASDDLEMMKVASLVRDIAAGQLEESSIEIVAKRDWKPAQLAHPAVRLHKIS